MSFPEKEWFKLADLEARWNLDTSTLIDYLISHELQAYAILTNIESEWYEVPDKDDPLFKDFEGWAQFDGDISHLFHKGKMTFQLRTWFDDDLLLSIFSNGSGKVKECIEDGITYKFVTPATVSASELFVTLEEVRAFEEKHPHGQKPVSSSPAFDNLPPDLDLAFTAFRKFWGDNVSRSDKTTHPKNALVVCWLEQQGMSHRRAEVVAMMIRPDWAPRGGRPATE